MMKAPLQPLETAILSLVVLAVTGCTPATSGPTYVVEGRAMAGPTCPVEPPSPLPGQCDERPVAGAVLVISDGAGHEVTRVTAAPDGSFETRLGAGHYTLTPQPVSGLIGGAAPIDFTVSSSGVSAPLDVEYDTGIR